MRITFLTPPDDLSGGLRVIAQYAIGLQSRGHAVTVVNSARSKPSLKALLRGLIKGTLLQVWQSGKAQRGHLFNSGVKCHVLDRAPKINAIDVPDGDVIVATWWKTAVWMNELPTSKGKPVHLIQGYEVWGYQPEVDRVHSALGLPNLKIAISNGLKEEIESKVGKLDIHVIPNAIDGDFFDAPPRGRNSPPRVGFIYSRSRTKGADRYYDVIHSARRALPELQVLAFGVEKPSQDLPLPTGTKFIECPSQRDIPGLYAQCDAWLFASRVDSFGLPILEAMACRTPVIGLPVGAAPDLLAGGCGVLVTPLTEVDIPQAISDALVDFLQKPETDWRTMSDRAHKRAHRYGWNDAVYQFEQLITSTADDNFSS